MLLSKYLFDFSEECIKKEITRLTNQLWKLIPMRENKEDWDAYIELAKVCIQLNQNNLAEGYLLTVKEKNPTFKAAEIDTLLESIK